MVQNIPTCREVVPKTCDYKLNFAHVSFEAGCKRMKSRKYLVYDVFTDTALSGNPLAMVAGLWSLKRLNRSLYRQLSKLGQTLAAGLADAARDAEVPLHVNALGSMLTPFFTAERVRDFRSALTSDTAAFGIFLIVRFG